MAIKRVQETPKDLIKELFYGLEITYNHRDNIKSKVLINYEILDEYIDFCIERKQDKGIKHHILPKSLFNSIKELKTYKWNEVILSKEDHIFVHYLLMTAMPLEQTIKAFRLLINTYKDKDIINSYIIETKVLLLENVIDDSYQ